MSLKEACGVAEEGSFPGLNLKNSLAVAEAVGMWESRSDFQGRCETRRVLHGPSFPPPWRTRPQLLEEFAFGLLHTLGGFGIADRRGDTL